MTVAAIGCLPQLRDDPLEMHFAGLAIDAGPVADHMAGITDRATLSAAALDQLRQLGFELKERKLAQIAPVQEEQIKYEVDKPLGGAAGKSVLQRAEARHAVLAQLTSGSRHSPKTGSPLWPKTSRTHPHS